MFKNYSSKISLIYIVTTSSFLMLAQFLRFNTQIRYLNTDISTNAVFASDNEYPFINSTATQEPENSSYSIIKSVIADIKVDSNKVNKIRNYLTLRSAPLAGKAEYIVRMAEKFKIDYRLVAAISVIESNGGKYSYKPYNAWGWGGSTSPYAFKNWEEGIYTVSKGLAKYYSCGAKTPEQIAPRYNPHTPNEWARKVRWVMNQM